MGSAGARPERSVSGKGMWGTHADLWGTGARREPARGTGCVTRHSGPQPSAPLFLLFFDHPVLQQQGPQPTQLELIHISSSLLVFLGPCLFLHLPATHSRIAWHLSALHGTSLRSPMASLPLTASSQPGHCDISVTGPSCSVPRAPFRPHTSTQWFLWPPS